MENIFWIDLSIVSDAVLIELEKKDRKHEAGNLTIMVFAPLRHGYLLLS